MGIESEAARKRAAPFRKTVVVEGEHEAPTYIRPREHPKASRFGALAVPYVAIAVIGDYDGSVPAAFAYISAPLRELSWLLGLAPIAGLHGLIAYYFPWSIGYWAATAFQCFWYWLACVFANFSGCA